jgi:hypothetical protein
LVIAIRPLNVAWMQHQCARCDIGGLFSIAHVAGKDAKHRIDESEDHHLTFAFDECGGRTRPLNSKIASCRVVRDFARVTIVASRPAVLV